MFNTAMHAEYIHDHVDYGFTTSEIKFDNIIRHRGY